MVEMLRYLLRAAACSLALLMLFGSVQYSSGADEVKHNACPKTLWRIRFDNSFKQGEAILRFDIPYQDKVVN